MTLVSILNSAVHNCLNFLMTFFCSDVGKTSIMNKYSSGKFTQTEASTIGFEMLIRKQTLDNSLVQLQVCQDFQCDIIASFLKQKFQKLTDLEHRRTGKMPKHYFSHCSWITRSYAHLWHHRQALVCFYSKMGGRRRTCNIVYVFEMLPHSVTIGDLNVT